jgi:hypothetical protein
LKQPTCKSNADLLKKLSSLISHHAFNFVPDIDGIAYEAEQRMRSW